MFSYSMIPAASELSAMNIYDDISGIDECKGRQILYSFVIPKMCSGKVTLQERNRASSVFGCHS